MPDVFRDACSIWLCVDAIRARLAACLCFASALREDAGAWRHIMRIYIIKWPYTCRYGAHPLAQLHGTALALPRHIIERLNRGQYGREASLDHMRDTDPRTLSKMNWQRVLNEYIYFVDAVYRGEGHRVYEAVRALPHLEVECDAQPLTATIIRVLLYARVMRLIVLEMLLLAEQCARYGTGQMLYLVEVLKCFM
jgi:hypothetical protein